MKESIQILEYRRKYKNNRDKFINHINYVCDVFGIDGKMKDKYVSDFDKMGEKMTENIIEVEKLNNEINELNYNSEKLRQNIISDNNIDIKDKILKHPNKDVVLNELWKGGFVSNDMYEILKDMLWNERRSRMRESQPKYELPKWM